VKSFIFDPNCSKFYEHYYNALFASFKKPTAAAGSSDERDAEINSA